MMEIRQFIAFLFILTFYISSFSQNNQNLNALDTIESNQEKLDFIGKTIISELYSNPENITYYAKIYDSITTIENTLENKSNALNYKGMAHYVSHEYDSAINYYLQAARILEKEKPGEKLSRVYNNLAACYNIRSDFKNTEKYFLKSLDIASAVKDMPWVANINNNLSILYMQNKMYAEAENAIDNALVHFENKNDSLMMGIAYMNYGNSKLFSEKFEDAINYYNKSLVHVKQNQIPIVHAVAQTGIGIGLTKRKDYAKALPYLKKGADIAKEIKHDEQLMESYNALADYYSITNNYKEAYELSKESQSLKDSILSRQEDKNMADALTKFETEKKDTELKLLQVEGEKKEQQKRLYSVLAIAGLCIAGLLGFFGYKNQQKNNKLAKQKLLLENTLDEKNTLLKEVHHRVKNSFQIVSSLLYLQSENMDDKEAKIAIKEAENRVRSMVLVHQKLYNKDELVGINSKEYITDLVKDIFDSHNVHKEPINYNLNVESLVLDIETITPLGLILNELIINALKHGFDDTKENKSITIDFTKSDDKLVLIVTDNGKGFEGDIKQTSFGITLMKALSKQLKASLIYDSKPNQGTEVLLNISKFKVFS